MYQPITGKNKNYNYNNYKFYLIIFIKNSKLNFFFLQ